MPLNAKQLEQFAQELDALKENIMADLGQTDVDHIRHIMRLSRGSEIVGRTLIHFSLDPITWSLGVIGLGVSKILENMELGHNIMHGQYDWTNDPQLNSQTYEWDTACESDSWRYTHNYEHHTYTNIRGKDRDYGYGLLRLSHDIPWAPRHLAQFLNFIGLTVFFQWGVALHELEIERIVRREISLKDKLPFLKRFLRKGGKQAFKDYLFFPLLAGPFAPKVFLGNLAANGLRNLWASSVIFCGHFTEGAQSFPESVCENETRGHWYYRQLLGAGNFTGNRWLHILTGHLSFQIEHHLFPDIPAHRYAEISPKIKDICETYGLPYNTGSFWSQYKTVVQRVLKYSLPPTKAALA
ncbi:MAG: acyl-CoA desaturase [Pseudomonadales bacterium]|nr:acyl-CoA desaturase [Pseudomonadales bacterium]